MYSAINLTQTGKLKRNAYFQTGERYYSQLEDSYFSEISDDALAQILQIAIGEHFFRIKKQKNPTAPSLTEPSFVENVASVYTGCVLARCFFFSFYNDGVSEILSF